jgi:hypothetical protein
MGLFAGIMLVRSEGFWRERHTPGRKDFAKKKIRAEKKILPEERREISGTLVSLEPEIGNSGSVS